MKTLRKITYAYLLVLAFPILGLPQPPYIQGSRIFGASGEERCYSVQQTSDSGYILAGLTSSFGAGNQDFWLIRLDTNGDSIWTKTFGGNSYDACYSALQVSDGGFVLAGYTNSFGAGDRDFWLVKSDENGDSLWSRTFGGSGSDVCQVVQQTSDGGYFLAGYSSSFGSTGNFWLMKTDSNGDSLWSQVYGGGEQELCFSAQQTSDNGFILAGFTYSFGTGFRKNFWLVKTDSLGNQLWNRAYGGSEEEWCYSVLQASDGGFIMAGYVRSHWPSDFDFLIIKTDANGDSLWSRVFGGSAIDECHSIQSAVGEGYVLAGYGGSYGSHFDFWLLRVDTDGDSLWSQTYGRSYDFCRSVAQTADGGYVLAGDIRFGPVSSHDFLVVKTGPDPSAAEPREGFLPEEYTLHQNYPNPFNPSTRISYDLARTGHVTMKVFDLLGREVVTLVDGMQATGNHNATFDGSGLASGIYLCRLQVGEWSQTRKMVLLK